MQHCQQCHSPNSGAHAPLPEALSSVPWEDILKSLETGPMKAQGASLTADERKAASNARTLANYSAVEKLATLLEEISEKRFVGAKLSATA